MNVGKLLPARQREVEHVGFTSQFNESAKQNNEGVPCYRETNKGHGREEGRTYYTISVQKDQLPEKWSSVESVIKGIFRRTEKGKTTENIRYYISGLSADAAERIGHFVRSHWGVENGLHWILDVSMGEDGNEIMEWKTCRCCVVWHSQY